MPKKRVMSLGLMIYNLKRTFHRLNPDEDVEAIDWKSIDYPCSHESALRDMEYEYPEYKWFEEETLEEIQDEINEHEAQELTEKLLEEGYDEETIERMVEERKTVILKRGWREEWLNGERVYTKTVPVKLHKVKPIRGIIGTTCDPDLIGLEAKIVIVKRKSLGTQTGEY